MCVWADCQGCLCLMLLANQQHSHNGGQLRKPNSNCNSLLQGLVPLPKRELLYFTLLDPESEIFSITQFRKSCGREWLWQSYGQPLWPFQAQKECSDGSTDLSSGKTIGWWDYQQFYYSFAETCGTLRLWSWRDDQIRDHVTSFIKDRNLKAKFYCEETLNLGKLLEIIGQYHDKEALTFVPGGQVNNIQNKEESAGSATRQVILRKIVVAHVVTSVENAARSAILR